MTPYFLDCSHRENGWCLDCVKKIQDEKDDIERSLFERNGQLQELRDKTSDYDYLKWWRLNADFGPADQDVIDELNERYEQETGEKLPKGWGDEE